MSDYERRRYLLMAKDPVHVGTGGYRLGRVDNSIVREPGTRVPKIPGTSLHGAVRSYAARLYENPAAAGQTHAAVADPARDPICYTFGYINSNDENDEGAIAYAGVLHVFDAMILLFPAYSMRGAVWVSTRARLTQAGVSVDDLPAEWPANAALTTWSQSDPLNLGWLMLRTGGTVTVTPPAAWQDETWTQIQDRIVLVQETLFSQIVNSNLEVRTSVSINPDTGAAEDGALFTYEAMPRGTILTGEVTIDDYRGDPNGIFAPVTTTAQGNPLPGRPWENPLDVFESGLDLIAWFGVGGMGTRGFGRLARVGDPITIVYGS